MRRTTVQLPTWLRARAKKCARARGITLSTLVRAALEREIVAHPRARDPLFEDLPSFPEDKVPPRDLSQNLDDYLYGDKSPSSSTRRRTSS